MFDKKEEKDELRESYDHITESDERLKCIGLFSDEFRFSKNYSMNAVEKLRYDEFCKAHLDCLRNPVTKMSRFGTIGGGIEVSFMGTGLGNLIKVKCLHCGHYADITDTTHW